MLFGSAGCLVNVHTINLVLFHKHPKSGPSVRVQTCATRNVTSAHTSESRLPFSSEIYTQHTSIFPFHSPHLLSSKNLGFYSNKNDPRLFIQRKVFFANQNTEPAHLHCFSYSACLLHHARCYSAGTALLR